nr:TPA_asm: NADH dehydrogenase subunit 6 [Pseudomyrmex dendroicus]
MNKLNLIQFILFSLMIMIMMMMSLNNFHPIHLIILMILYSIMISINLSILKKSFMYSIMLFLMMISGVMIIFLYFSSLISNEKIYMLIWKKWIFMILLSSLLMFYGLKFMMNIQSINSSYEFKSFNMYQTNLFSNIEWIYLYPFNSMSILCMTFLLITMFTVIKIMSSKSMPLRKIN